VSTKITLVGVDVVRSLLAKGGTVGVDALSSVLRDDSLLAFRNSQRMTPHADGPLRASGVVKPPVVSGTHVEVLMGYGGAASAYALYQHENTQLRHPDPTNPHSDPKGQAKYLETPVRDQTKGLAKRLRDELESRLK
jgi:hypothetical protein